MRFIRNVDVLVLCALLTPAAFAAGGLAAPNLTIGRNLQTTATITLGEPAPAEGLQVTVASDDPSALLLSTRYNQGGRPSITVEIKGGLRESAEFWLQALNDSGTVAYTASAPGFGNAQASVTLTPSSIIIMGPLRGANFRTTPRGAASRLVLYSVRLDSSLVYAEQQVVAGMADVKVEIDVSDPAVGSVADSVVTIQRGTASGTTEFRPAKVGTTSINISVPPGFTRARDNHAVSAVVVMPGIMLTNDVMIGHNLQVGGLVGLGEPAPEGGVSVTLTSEDPAALLLASSPTTVGSKTLNVQIGAGKVSAPFYLQAIASSGAITYTANAPGHQSRTATVHLAPSGIVILPKPYGPPDEAEVMRPHEVHAPRGVVASLSKKPKVPLAVWAVQLDPATRRGADITVQPLGPGAPVTVLVKSSDPKVGTVLSPVTIKPGSEFGLTELQAVSEGSTVISVLTPKGFTEPSNSTSFTAHVRQ